MTLPNWVEPRHSPEKAGDISHSSSYVNLSQLNSGTPYGPTSQVDINGNCLFNKNLEENLKEKCQGKVHNENITESRSNGYDRPYQRSSSNFRTLEKQISTGKFFFHQSDHALFNFEKYSKKFFFKDFNDTPLP